MTAQGEHVVSLLGPGLLIRCCCCCRPVSIPCPAWPGCNWMPFNPGSNTSDFHWDLPESYRGLTGAKFMSPSHWDHSGIIPRPHQGVVEAEEAAPLFQELPGPFCVIHQASPVLSLHPQELLGPFCVIHQASPVLSLHPPELLGPFCVIHQASPVLSLYPRCRGSPMP